MKTKILFLMLCCLSAQAQWLPPYSNATVTAGQIVTLSNNLYSLIGSGGGGSGATTNYVTGVSNGVISFAQTIGLNDTGYVNTASVALTNLINANSVSLSNRTAGVTNVVNSSGYVKVTSTPTATYNTAQYSLADFYADDGFLYASIAANPADGTSRYGYFSLFGTATSAYGNLCGWEIWNTNLNNGQPGGERRAFVIRVKDPGGAAIASWSDKGAYALFESRYSASAPDRSNGAFDLTYANFLLCDENGNVGLGDLGQRSDDPAQSMLHPWAKTTFYPSYLANSSTTKVPLLGFFPSGYVKTAVTNSFEYNGTNFGVTLQDGIRYELAQKDTNGVLKAADAYLLTNRFTIKSNGVIITTNATAIDVVGITTMTNTAGVITISFPASGSATAFDSGAFSAFASNASSQVVAKNPFPATNIIGVAQGNYSGLTALTANTGASQTTNEFALLIKNTSGSGQSEIGFDTAGAIMGLVRVDQTGIFNWQATNGHVFYTSTNTAPSNGVFLTRSGRMHVGPIGAFFTPRERLMVDGSIGLSNGVLKINVGTTATASNFQAQVYCKTNATTGANELFSMNSGGIETQISGNYFPTNAASISWPTTNFIPSSGFSGTRYTNLFGQRGLLMVSFGFVDAVTGTPVVKAVIEQNGSGGAKTNTFLYSMVGTISSTVTNTACLGIINPNAVVTITDISGGSGASVTVANSELELE